MRLQFVMSESLKIITKGQGPELVLLHGWAMHSGIWSGVVDALATKFRVNLVDLPGHGINRHLPLSSDLNTVAQLILSEVPPAAWIGWSLGGLITLQAALAQPQKVQQMVLVAATPSFTKRSGWDCGIDAAAQQVFTEGLESGFERAVDQFCLQTFGANWITDALYRLGVSSFTENAPTNKTLQTGLQLLYSSNLLPRLSDCNTSSLFLGGSRDRTVRPESLGRAAALMPNARTRLITTAGHAPFISHEGAFLDIIREFLHTGKRV